MTENKEGKVGQRSKKYFTLLIIILFIVQLLDSYSTQVPNVIPSAVINEFLPGFPGNIADSRYQLAVGIATCGTFLVFVIQFFADRFGRKVMLVITVLGMSLSALLLITATNIIQYTLYLFMVYWFFSSDMWLIYINEESHPKSRAKWTNVILAGGVGGPLLLPVFRNIFMTETSTNWRGMWFFGIILGIPLAIIIFLTIKETTKFQEIKNSELLGKNPFTLARENLGVIRKSKHWKELLILVLMSFFIGLNYNFLSTGEKFLSGYFTDKSINTLITFLGVSVILGFLLTGVFADKIGRKPMIIIYSIMLPASMLITIIGVNLPTNAYAVTAIGYCLTYVAFWGLLSVVRIVTFETLETENRGTGSGFRGFCYALGITVGLLVGSSITSVSSLAVSYLFLSLFVIIDIPLTIKFIKETRGTNLSKIDKV